MFFVCVNRKNLKVSLAATMTFVSIFFTMLIATNVSAKTGGKYDDRVKFLQGLGCVIDQSETELSQAVVVPADFNEVYKDYNSLQKQAGFNIEIYRGKTINQYTIKLKDFCGRDDVYAHILVHEDKIIGGDIAAVALDGFMLPLDKQKIEKQML